MAAANTDYKSQADKTLVDASLSGDSYAFEELVNRHFSAVFLTARARLHEHETAEDLSQEVFLRAYLHLEHLDNHAKFAHWVCRIARNLAEDWRRRKQVASRLIPMITLEDSEMAQVPDRRNEDPRTRAERLERDRVVNEAIAALPIECREIVLLYYIEGLSEREIADRFGLHRTTVRYHRLKAESSFKAGMDKWLAKANAALKPPHNAMLLRTMAIVTTAAALPESAKAALKSSSLSGMPGSASLKSVAAGATQNSPATSVSLIKLFPASAAIGASLVKGKILTVGATVFLLSLLGGGAYYSGLTPLTIGNAEVSITESLKSDPSTSFMDDSATKKRIEAKHLPLSVIAANLVHETPKRILLEIPFSFKPYNAIFTGVSSHKVAEKLFKTSLEKNFQLTLVHEKRVADVLLLQCAATTGSAITPAGRFASEEPMVTKPGRMSSKAIPMKTIAHFLEMQLELPVVDATGLDGLWQFRLRWHDDNRESLRTSLQKQLGLQLVPGKAETEFVVLRPLNADDATTAVSLTQAITAAKMSRKGQ